jgi:hypothetical protein
LSNSIYGPDHSYVNQYFVDLQAVVADMAGELREAERANYRDCPAKEQRFGTVDALWHMGGDTFITLMERPGFSRAHLEDKLYALKCRLNRKGLGPDWAKHKDQQLKGLVFFECSGGHEHAHLIVTLPQGVTHQDIKEIWSRLVDRGVCQVDPVWNADGLLTYVTKTWWWNAATDWRFIEEISARQA